MKMINEKNSKAFMKNLKNLMQSKGLTQLELIKKFNEKGIKIGQSTISDWLNKGNLPRDDNKFNILCSILNVNKNDLLPEEEQPLSKFSNVVPFKYKILGTVACGEPTETFEDDGLTYIVSNTKINADFALFARGDSMVDFGIKDGYIVFIKKYNSQADVRNGDIAVVRVNGETTLKKFYFDQKNKIATLIPGNSKYKPLIYTEENVSDFEVVGKAVYFQGLVK